MSRFSIFSEGRGGVARTVPAAATPENVIQLIDGLTPISHWRLNESEGVNFADRLAVADMVATGSPQRLTAAIVDNDLVPACIACDGIDDVLIATNPASKPYDVTAGAIGAFIQADTSTPSKQHIINRAGNVAGSMALEYLSGGQVRFWRRDGANVVREVVGSIGAAPAGNAGLLVGSWGAAGLKLHYNGVLLGTVAITNWAVDAALNANVVLGRWSSAIEHFDGVIAHAFFLGAQPTNAQVNTLSEHRSSIAWAEDIDAGTVVLETTKTISLKSAGAHFKAPIVPSIVAQGSLGTSSANGEAIDYLAGSIVGFDDPVTIKFTSANGVQSQNRTLTIDVIEELEFPLTQSGTVGWVSTTHSAFGSPSHGASIENLPNVSDGATLFTQSSAGLRGTWDSTTLDVPVIRSDGTQYYTKAVALTAPSLIIVAGIIDSDAGGVYRAWSGARSTATPGGDPQEDAWTLNNSNTGTMRGLVAASGGIAFSNVPQRLNAKALIVMEVSASQLTVWQNGVQSVSEPIIGTKIVVDAGQALLAKYYNDTITAIMKGGIAEFYQNSVVKTKAEIRALISYFQGVFWPSGTPPATATVAVGDFAQGSTTDVHILAFMAVAGIDTTGMTLVSIHEQSGNAGVSVSVVSGQARVAITSGAALGATSFVYCIEKAGLVGFGTCSLNVTAASATNSIPLTPPAGTTFWVAPGGTGNGNSVNNPAGSWIDVLNGGGHRAVVAGDTIAVRGGSYFNERGKTVTGKSGTSGSPIRIVGYHPDGQTRPRIDNSHPDFRGGSVSSPLSVWQAAGVGPAGRVWQTVGTGYTSVINALQAYGDARDGELRFCGYETSTGWDSMINTTFNSYGGPGVFKGNGTQGTNGRLYISTEPGKFATESGENFPLVTSGGARNPNHMDLKFVWQNDTMLTLNGCSHLHFFNHEWFYSRTIMKLSGTCTGLEFHYVEHRAGFRGYQFQGTISSCIWQWCKLFHGLPLTFQWRDAKSSAHPFGQYVGGTYEWGSESGATLLNNWWLNCTFDRAFDVMVWLEGNVKGNKYLNCDFIYCRDDNIDYENSIAEEEVGYCRFFGCFAPFSWRGGNDVPSRPESELRYYIHHSIFHMIYSLYQRSLTGTYTTEPVVFLSNARAPTSVSTEHSGAEGSKKCRNFAHCTLIYGGSKTGPTLADRMSHWNANQALTIPGWSMNNIIVCKHWDCIGYDVVDEFMRDGDCLHHINPSSGRVIVKSITDRTFTKSFSTLSAAVGDSQVQSASDPLPYPGGGTWMQNAIVADPQFAAAAYDLVSQPQAPYAGSVYKPANTACHSGARNLSTMAPTIKWGTAASPTRSYSYEAWRGAVNPSGDGSEVGPQPLQVLP